MKTIGRCPPIPGGYHVEYKGENYEILSDWKLGESLFNGTCNGEEFTCRSSVTRPYSLFHWGTRADFMVMSARAAELLALMPEKWHPTSPSSCFPRCLACSAKWRSRSVRK
jgi:propionyl-CoA carboxylase alpha chain